MFSKFRFSSVKYSIILLAILAVSLVPKITKGATITFEYFSVFNKSTPPAGSTPWLTATFDDSFGDSNTVRLTMEATNLAVTEVVNGEDTDYIKEYVSAWYFNLDPSLDPNVLTIAYVSDEVASVGVSTGINAFQAGDEGGLFDILFEFPPPPGGIPNFFTQGLSSVYDISLSDGLTADSFNFRSFMDGDGLLTAAFVQGTGVGGEDSAWVSVPDPTTMSLLGIGLAGLAGRWVRRRIGQKKVEGRK